MPAGSSRAQSPFSPTAARHLLRTDGFRHVADIMVGSFYDPELDEGCAFEELISFHGGIGGPQTRPFILHPVRLDAAAGPIVCSADVHGILRGWRHLLQGGEASATELQPAADGGSVTVSVAATDTARER